MVAAVVAFHCNQHFLDQKTGAVAVAVGVVAVDAVEDRDWQQQKLLPHHSHDAEIVVHFVACAAAAAAVVVVFVVAGDKTVYHQHQAFADFAGGSFLTTKRKKMRSG